MDSTPLARADAGQQRAAFAALAQLLGDRFTEGLAVREHHGRDLAFHEGLPDAVAFAQSTLEVAEILRLCHRHRVPVVPFGTGTSLEGHIAALAGGLSLDVSRMNAVLEVNSADLDCRVEAGVTRKQLNSFIKDQGLFFPIDPGADASLGGMTATRASGTNAVRYGTMRENVLGLTVVMPDGTIIKTGGRARKSAAGYDLTRLFIGSEGTLGVITEVQLRLYGIPEAMSAAASAFDSLAGAINTVIETIQLGIPVARIELLDEVQVAAINRYSKLTLIEKPTLFFEFHGSAASVLEQAAVVGEIASGHGSQGFQWATQEEDRRRLWQARHDAYYACLALKPGAKAFATDVCVPISRLADCILETQADIQHQAMLAPIVGHVGDGNFHLVVLLNPDDPAERARADALNERLVKRALAMGGTCTGEHGIGYGKRAFLEQEHGSALSVMRQVKQALDPLGIMNPGKIL